MPAVTSAEDRLQRYREKREFGRTPEPPGEIVDREHLSDSRRFVVQHHRARRAHYDLRLEIDGVLVSWAVPRGPTLDPSVRRLAVRTEDHPVEYLDFEGVIPRGEYGAGDMIVWDQGHYSLTRGDDAASALDAGELHVELRGEKLAGRFALVRTGRSSRDGEQWLLIHGSDDHAVDGLGDDPEIVSDHDQGHAEFGLELPAAFEDLYRARLLDAFRRELRVMPHVHEVLAGMGCPFCVATSSSPGRARMSLELTGLRDLVGTRLFTASMVAQGKPAPDLFLHAAREMGEAPAACLVIEDSLAGIRAARAAGMAVWRFVGGSHLGPATGPEPEEARPDRRLVSFDSFFQIAPDLRRMR